MTDRLPKTVRPASYAITLDASPKRKTFLGEVVISLTVGAPTEVVVLNARGLKIERAVCVLRAGKRLVAKTRLFKDKETVELRFAEPLPKGKAQLTIDFAGKLDASMHGLYLAKDGALRALVSQCEATDARAIFPCFDEPEFKAQLQWTVRTDPGLVVVTNGVLDKVTRKKTTAVHAFKKTRPVSSYLAAVTIGPYEAAKPFRVSGTSCRILAGPGKLDQTRFAETVTRFVLPWYEDYFAQRYHYQKLDQVAVPGFDAGAMENIGAIFYRQGRLLMQPESTSWANEKSIAEVIAHEIAHQWFGNRVTMSWWDDLWLNEAFATWVSFKAIDAWRSEWRMWDDYQEDKEAALVADALESTHPIYTEVKSPAEATELFDVITYSKGGAVLRMAEQFLGAQSFKSGIRRYMGAFKDSNATGGDLWKKLGEASGQPVPRIMESWTKKAGFPLLACERSGETLTLSQQRFFSNPNAAAGPDAWVIPVVLRFQVGDEIREQRLVLDSASAEVALGASPKWVCANANGVGFYRTAYSKGALAELLLALDALSPAERMGLIEDQWALVVAGRRTIDEFLDVLWAYEGEDDYVVVRAMAMRLRTLAERLVSDDDRPRLSALTCRLFARSLRELGFQPESGEMPPEAVRRAEVIDVLGDIVRDSSVLDQAERLAEKEEHDTASVEPNLAAVVVALSGLRGDKQRLDQHVRVFLSRQSAGATPELQQRYLSSLPYFVAPELIGRVLALCVDGTVPQEQLRAVVVPMLQRRETQRQTWIFLKAKWRDIGPRIGAMGISRLVEATGGLPVDLEADVAQFFAEHPVPEANRALQKALEAMALRRQLLAREGERLHDWLGRQAA